MSTHPTEFTIEPAWRLILKDLGVSENEILRRAGLPGDIFSRPNGTLGTDGFFQLWEALEKSLNDPTFPLRVGQMISAEAFHPLFFAALCSPNMNVAMQRISQYKRLVGPMTLEVNEGVEATTLTLDCLYTDRPLPDSLAAAELVFLVKLVRMATREPVKPIAVTTTSRLLGADAYAEYFGRVPAVQSANCLAFSLMDARRPFLTENPGMWAFFEPGLRQRLADLTTDATFASRVESALFELLPGGMSSIDAVAEKLAVSRRTLQRELAGESTTFQKELNKVRERLARHYLTKSTLPGEQISFLLGFDDPNSFARAFRTWTGETPGAVRKMLQGS